MIDFLSHWMRGLVLIIFLAVILEMIIPNNAFQRYVRLVMGLMIIALMLSPVFKLYSQSQTSTAWSIDDLFKNNGQTMESIDQIQKDSQQLQQMENSQAVVAWKQAITTHLKTEIEQNHPSVTVETVTIDCTTDTSGQPKDLQSVQVALIQKQDPNQITPIKPIAKVTIDKAQDTAQTTAQPALTKEEKQNVTAIRSEIAGEYNLDRSKVNVVWQNS